MANEQVSPMEFTANLFRRYSAKEFEIVIQYTAQPILN